MLPCPIDTGVVYGIPGVHILLIAYRDKKLFLVNLISSNLTFKKFFLFFCISYSLSFSSKMRLIMCDFEDHYASLRMAPWGSRSRLRLRVRATVWTVDPYCGLDPASKSLENNSEINNDLTIQSAILADEALRRSFVTNWVRDFPHSRFVPSCIMESLFIT